MIDYTVKSAAEQELAFRFPGLQGGADFPSEAITENSSSDYGGLLLF